ncbi:hypothetical protein BU24DRAFT_417099 [Aaosphaeria arxii CBS 175.79]|uniref:RBR-type E3 ubiquitin transferase n=1 Tax=Aaosphaeria arxii CBS 175.79 TaxID=1450172 RepID=A0A6A5Y812_9PLEO|nr:uncharacterized protein BU24DRAFT_417099 [Aaosphaeria arxii CBS 175.79]KAF2021446.1 hypothetical protein BU24DRAFT_417099 [Aaosphaeria arxii CBS 175.79]
MATGNSDEVYDLLILVDATYSMFNYLESLKISLPKVISISNLTDSFERVGLLAYRDYSEFSRANDGMLEWSGWLQHGEGSGREGAETSAASKSKKVPSVTAESVMRMAANLEPIGGGDYPEATKTGLAYACTLMREDATTIVLLYTDAPPHCWMVADRDKGSNYHAEQAALSKKDTYDGFGQYFIDWVSAAKQLHQGPRKAHVFSFLDRNLGTSALNAGYYNYLSTITRGACLYLTDARPHNIAKVTVDVLLAWMGTGKDGSENVQLPAKLMRYKNGATIKQIKNERDDVANQYFWASTPNPDSKHGHLPAAVGHQHARNKLEKEMEDNVAETALDSNTLRQYLPKRKTPVQDFALRYRTDEIYRRLVATQLMDVIERDVASMSLNPVFGTLWRAICNDRENPERESLITAFGLQIETIKDAEEKARMKLWLEESYDYAAEILEILDSVPEDERYPCVFLDPTIAFTAGKKAQENESAGNSDEVDVRPITEFRRDELLEIGRSCDGRILRRLGKILTQLSFAHSAADLPAHIAVTTNKEVPRIPLSLGSKDNGWKLWRILLHTVLPGTMLAARPAMLLAALSIRIGLTPLFSNASAALLSWKSRWNNLEVPETWNSSCLGLLLDADAEYRKQVQEADNHAEVASGLLGDSDRELFTQLVHYQHARANLLTTLHVDIGWTPDKTAMPVGPTVQCRGCEYPRSVTIMVEKSGGKCGLCITNDFQDANHKSRALNAHVNKHDDATATATWVECSVQACRAQYVCYNPEDLNVRPKCHFCRTQKRVASDTQGKPTAPTLECEQCLSRIIWPHEFRKDIQHPFKCTACVNNRKTVESTETNAERICKENGQGWLLQNTDKTVAEPFQRSLFHTISKAGTDKFMANVRILPELDPDPALTMHGKLIRNKEAMKATLMSWIKQRTFERTPCALCFSDFPNARLLPACRRRGCNQRICEGCLNSWYGSNQSGSIINTAALFCPFCRRLPAARTLAAYGMGIHAVGDLRNAVQERGEWIHAWCSDCGNARRYLERECARGTPDAVQNWRCEGCIAEAQERARIAEQEARDALALVERIDAEGRRNAEQALEEAKRLQEEFRIPVKKCPGCKTRTLKVSGCNHITCTIGGCGTHWCWGCGKEFNRDEIYEHMESEHGGLYG